MKSVIERTVYKICFFSVCSLFLSVNYAHAEKIWELGVGAGAINLPLYPGASKTRHFFAPLPYVRFKTKHFEVDEGVRAYMYESESYRLLVSAGMDVSVNNDSDSSRRGMPNLNPVLQIGPALEYIFSGGKKQNYEFKLNVPMRSAIAMDFDDLQNIGWLTEPSLVYEVLRKNKMGLAYKISGGLKYGSEKYNRYYYDVKNEYVDTTRSFYQSNKGYNGFFLDLNFNWRQKNIIYVIAARYQNLKNTEFEGSPIIDDDQYIAFAVGAIWVFSESR